MSDALLGLNLRDALIGGLGAATVAMAVTGLAMLARRQTLRSRLTAFAQLADLSQDRPTDPVARGSLQRLGESMERLLPSRWVEWLASRVERAGGNLGSFEPSAVLALRLIATLFGVLLGFVFLAGTGFGMLGIAAAAIMVPLGLGGVDLLLHSRAGARRKLAEAELPTILDLLSLSMGAGMAFEMALKTILHRLHGPLASELRRYAVDVEALGAPRDKALLGVAYRLGGAPDVFAFVEAINAAHLLGTGLLVAVGSQATLLRQNRRRRAAASAQRAPVRMLIPMTLFMLPTLMMVVLAPVALRLTGAAQ